MIGTSRHRCLTLYPAAISSVKRWSYLQFQGLHSPLFTRILKCNNSCLMSMGSPSCPLCRKPFIASRIVRLHVDRQAPSERGVEDVELLQRLDAEEAKRQVELEAAVEQSKQRKRALRESLERARRLQRQREEEAEALKQQPTNVAVPSPREIRIDEMLQLFSESSVTRTVEAAAPPSTRWGRGEGGGVWRARRDALASSLESSAAPPSSLWGRGDGGWARREALASSLESSAAPPSTSWGRGEGGGWRARQDTNTDLTRSLASSTRAPLRVNAFFSLLDGNGSP